MSLLKGFHKHHIIPKYKGGSDSPENLVLLHPIDHAIAHLVRYKMYGNVRDKWASNWLQNIVETEVYTQFSKEREQGIRERRAIDKDFDEHMRTVRSNATKDRQEGYQKQAGEEFRKRMQQDDEFASRISVNRKKANAASIKVRQSIVLDKVAKVRQMRAEGYLYKQIQQETGYSLASISYILNNKILVGVGEINA
jgi:hypothetical protein